MRAQDTLTHIFTFLGDPAHITLAGRTNHLWYQASTQNQVWRYCLKKYFPEVFDDVIAEAKATPYKQLFIETADYNYQRLSPNEIKLFNSAKQYHGNTFSLLTIINEDHSFATLQLQQQNGVHLIQCLARSNAATHERALMYLFSIGLLHYNRIEQNPSKATQWTAICNEPSWLKQSLQNIAFPELRQLIIDIAKYPHQNIKDMLYAKLPADATHFHNITRLQAAVLCNQLNDVTQYATTHPDLFIYESITTYAEDIPALWKVASPAVHDLMFHTAIELSNSQGEIHITPPKNKPLVLQLRQCAILFHQKSYILQHHSSAAIHRLSYLQQQTLQEIAAYQHDNTSAGLGL